MNDESAKARSSQVLGPSGLGRIDQYILEKELGGGAFGTVYLAHDTVSDIRVAVKGLPPEVRNNLEELENVRDNFKLVSRLHHPNIAAALVLHPAQNVVYGDKSVHDKLRVDPNDTLMVMEYAPGMTLSRWRKVFPGRRIPVNTALRVVRQIAQALDFAHARRIIHRDIKPANIMVETSPDEEVTARVLDFGLAAEVRSSMGRLSLEVREMSGTRQYMAPEQWKGEKQGAATDQYSLAVLFCELVSGEVPFQSVFESGDPVMMLAAMIKRDPVVPEGVPSQYRRAVLRALSKNPNNRFPSCEAFVDALEGKVRIPKLALPIVGTLLLAVLVGGGFAWHRWTEHVRRTTEESAAIAMSNRLAKAEMERERIRREQAEAERRRHEAEAAAAAAQALSNQLAQAALERQRRDEAERERVKREQEAADRKRREAEAAEAERERVKREQEAADRKRRDEEAERERVKREREEAERRRMADEAAAKVAARDALLKKLAGGSEFLPNPPELAAGTERVIPLSETEQLKFVWCPPGRFLMGSPETEIKRFPNEGQHLVTLTNGFWMGCYEVTRSQWNVVMGSSRFMISSIIKNVDNYPVDSVSWFQCREFCQKLSAKLSRDGRRRMRLPTEAEWEYACRAGTSTPFNFGSALNGDRACCAGAEEPYGMTDSNALDVGSTGSSLMGSGSLDTSFLGPGSNNYSGSAKVGSYAPNAWGLYDMHGNLFEWCSDYYGEYDMSDAVSPQGPESGASRVRRGGCWSHTPKLCRSAFRSRNNPSTADKLTGLRLCCDEL